MKTRAMSLVAITALVLTAVSAGAIAATTRDGRPTADTAKMEACFHEHGKLMSKPALTNMYDCWRVHGYLMGR